MSDKVTVLYRRYRPSNGTEGEIFMHNFCDRCVKNNPDREQYCDILGRTLAYNVDDPEYPPEWICDNDLNPRCTAFEPKL